MQLIDDIPSMTEAIRCCVRLSRLTDKQVYLELGIDAGNWSRIINGLAHFPQDKYLQLFKICRNDIPLQWLSKQLGYELKPLNSLLEKKVNSLKKEKEELEQKLQTIVEILQQANIPTINQ